MGLSVMLDFEVHHFFKQFDKTGTPFVDEHGLLWMETSENGRSAIVGLSAKNVLARDSDPQLAHELLLTRVGRVLKSPKHGRETMSEFVQDWTTLQQASEKRTAALALSDSLKKGAKASSSQISGDD